MRAIFLKFLMAACLAPVFAAHAGSLSAINHFVVIYQENHSFDNLYGGWEGVDGSVYVSQVSQEGKKFGCLMQVDVNLSSPPLEPICADSANGIKSHFPNAPFAIDEFIRAQDKTCPPPGEYSANGYLKGRGIPGGCTMDLSHRFYQEQYQINGGKMDRYVTGSDAAGLSMGHYDTKKLPIYAYLHGKNHPSYVIADHFFQAAFGGSFLNHQWLISARTPEFENAVGDGSAHDMHSVVDANGMPGSTPLYASPGATRDRALTVSCDSHKGKVACGDFAVNTVQPMNWPYAPKTPESRRLPPLTAPTIGDRLNEAKIDWAWYSGGWANAEGDRNQPGYTNGGGPECSDPQAMPGSVWPKCPDRLFQFHHQPFNYFEKYAPESILRKAHLRDAEEFRQLAASSARSCRLKAVSFVKLLGSENEHPGYASESRGSDRLVETIEAIEKSVCARDTMIIVAYDEFGGQADHVPPPSSSNPKGPYDRWGPGTRVPALILAPGLPGKFSVDHAFHDTTSILSTLEHRFSLSPLGSRDAAAKDLATVFRK